jgi:hypothetical protein
MAIEGAASMAAAPEAVVDIAGGPSAAADTRPSSVQPTAAQFPESILIHHQDRTPDRQDTFSYSLDKCSSSFSHQLNRRSPWAGLFCDYISEDKSGRSYFLSSAFIQAESEVTS